VRVRFVKVEGAGNDYVLVDVFEQQVRDPAALARAVSDRHRGIGSDGVLLVGPPNAGGVARMRIYNADGSEGRMCGNGLRCVVRYLVESGRASAQELVRVETASGLRGGRMLGAGRAETEMGVPDFRPASVPVRGTGDGVAPVEVALPPGLVADPDKGFCVSVGNPHVVVAVRDPAAVALAEHGRALERSPLFPEGANAHFVRLVGADRIEARTWERGSGETRACGTGAVGVAAVARRLGWLAAPRITVAMPGGDLHVRWDGSGPAWLEGPARLPVSGEWNAS
jgi:diaminopimelate epimerase